MEKSEIKKRIMKFLKENNSATYAEIERVFDSCGFEWEGRYEIVSGVDDNIILWSGWNQSAIELMNEMQSDLMVIREPTTFVLYLLDGRGLNLPQVTTFKEYKTPHWLPVIFKRGPRI